MAILRDIPDRTFGIEIELLHRSRRQIKSAIVDAGLPAALGRWSTSVDTETWLVVPDATVRGGFEVRSPILRGERGIDNARTVARAVEKAGARINKSCGFHVHVGVEDFDLARWKRLVKMFALHEDVMDLVLAPSRRGGNEYCLPSTHHVMQASGEYPDYLWTNMIPHQDRDRNKLLRLFCDKANSAASLLRLHRALYGGSRYHKLNMESWWRHRTVEFRGHQGTVESVKIYHWILLCLGLVEVGSTFNSRRPKLDRSSTWDRFWWFLDYRCALPAKRRRYFGHRALTFAEQEGRDVPENVRIWSAKEDWL